MLPRPLYAQGPFSWRRRRRKARCNDSQVEHYRGDIWAKRAEQFPGLIININKPKIYYQLTAESAKASVVLLPTNFIIVAVSFSWYLTSLSAAIVPLSHTSSLFIACGANKSLWLILIASDVQARHHFFRLILNLVLFSPSSPLPLTPSCLFLATLPLSLAPLQGVKLFAFLFCD